MGKPERTTDHGQATGKLYHLRLLVECTLFVIYKGYFVTATHHRHMSDRWFSPASSTTKTGRHDIAEILLKVVLKHQKSKLCYTILAFYFLLFMVF
jgi:hypothetical protein